MREMWEPPAFFETLGVRYTGPFDGHDIGGMEVALRNAAAHDGPIVVHVLTEKGRGYRPAEEHGESHLHDSGGFDLAVGSTTSPGQAPEYKQAFVGALLEAGEQRKDLVAITAAMPGSTGVLRFQERFPDRAFDVGIAEQHAVTMAAGMALGGLRPVVAVYATFLTRAFDQLMYDVGLHRLPVIFCLDRAGITGPDGPSHHGVIDLSMALRVPGMTVLCPSSYQELPVMFRSALEIEHGPVLIRWPKGAAPQVDPADVGTGLSARKLRTGDGTVAILALGRMTTAARSAASLLQDQDIDATVWDVRVAKPLDPAMLRDAAAHRLVVTVEDGVAVGGVGDAIALDLASRRDPAPRTVVLGTPDEYIPHGDPDELLADLGLDAVGIAARTVKAVRDLD
jgi:1-deoxy-D-xylulose-5-phosphate synthase